MGEEYGKSDVDDGSTTRMLKYFTYFSVSISTYNSKAYTTDKEQEYVESDFQIVFVRTNAHLMFLLEKLEKCKVVGVDFEGVKLCRHGALCLMQIVCDSDPACVHVIDVAVLGKNAFDIESRNGTSLRSLLEDDKIVKSWFDCRNDTDALFHQFGIMPKRIFDIQVADVLIRRNKTLSVKYLIGLTKAISIYVDRINDSEMNFAREISERGKGLYDPARGGAFEVFAERPLQSTLLIYSAFDSRHLLSLFKSTSNKLDGYTQSGGDLVDNMVEKVFKESQKRAGEAFSETYSKPDQKANFFQMI